MTDLFTTFTPTSLVIGGLLLITGAYFTVRIYKVGKKIISSLFGLGTLLASSATTSLVSSVAHSDAVVARQQDEGSGVDLMVSKNLEVYRELLSQHWGMIVIVIATIFAMWLTVHLVRLGEKKAENEAKELEYRYRAGYLQDEENQKSPTYYQSGENIQGPIH